MKRNLSSQAIRAMAIGMAVTLGSATAVSGVVTGTVVNVYALGSGTHSANVTKAEATTVNGKTVITLTLTGTLSKEGNITTSDYTISGATGSPTVESVEQSGQNVVIKLNKNIASSDKDVKITVADANTDNKACVLVNSAGFTVTDVPVTNNVDDVAPTIKDDVAPTYSKDDSTITLTASEKLNTLTEQNNTNEFEVKKVSSNGTDNAVVSKFIVGDGGSASDKLKLTLSTPAPGTSLDDGEYKINYKTEKPELKDEAGNKLVTKDNIASFLVTENQSKVTAKVNQAKTKVTLTTTGTLTKDGNPVATEFKVNGNTSANSINIDEAKKTITLTFNQALSVSNFKLSYDPSASSNAVKVDSKVLFLKDLAVTEDGQVSTAPTIQSGVINNDAPDKVVLTFSENIKVDSDQPNATDFKVKVAGQSNVVKSLSVINTTATSKELTLTLTTPVKKGEDVKLTYTKGTNAIKNSNGDELANIEDNSPISIQNNVKPPVQEDLTATTTAGTYTFEKVNGKDSEVALTEFKAVKSKVSQNDNTNDNTFVDGVLTVKGKTYNLTQIGDGTKAVAGLTTVALEGHTTNVTEIKEKAFENNTKVTTLSFPKVTTVGANAFNGATSLTTIDLGSQATKTTVANSAFTGASKIEKVTTNEASKADVIVAAQKGNKDVKVDVSISKDKYNVKNAKIEENKFYQTEQGLLFKGLKNNNLTFMGKKEFKVPTEANTLDGSEQKPYFVTYVEGKVTLQSEKGEGVQPPLEETTFTAEIGGKTGTFEKIKGKNKEVSLIKVADKVRVAKATTSGSLQDGELTVGAEKYNLTQLGNGTESLGNFESSVLEGNLGNVTTVKEKAFEANTTITTIILPNVTTIEANAFSGTSALTKIDLGSNDVNITENAFKNAGNGSLKIETDSETTKNNINSNGNGGSGITVENRTPEVVSGVVTKETSNYILTLTLSEKVFATQNPDNQDFIVKSGINSRALQDNVVKAISIENNLGNATNIVKLTLTNPVSKGDTVTVAYNKNKTENKQIKDTATSDTKTLESFVDSKIKVVNNIEDVPVQTVPVTVKISDSNVNGKVVTITTNEEILDNTTKRQLGTTDGFEVTKNGSKENIEKVEITANNKIQLTLNTAVTDNDEVKFEYKGGNSDFNSNDKKPIAPIAKTEKLNNQTQNVAPTILSGTFTKSNPGVIILTASEDLKVMLNSSSDFGFTVKKSTGSPNYTVSKVEVLDGNKKEVKITVTDDFTSGVDALKVTYTKPSNEANQIKDSKGALLENIEDGSAIDVNATRAIAHRDDDFAVIALATDKVEVVKEEGTITGITSVKDATQEQINSILTKNLITISSGAFKDAAKNLTLDFSKVNVSNLTIASDAFSGVSLKIIGVSDSDTKILANKIGSSSDIKINGKTTQEIIKDNSNSGNGGSGSGGGSSSGGSGGGSGANIGTITNKKPNTEETTSQGNKNETVVENKQLSFDVIKLPSVEGEAKVFGDVSANHWAKSYIDKLSTARIINGSNGMFNPNGQTKRADVTIMLVNLLGLTPEANNKFADVNASAYYAPYVGTASTYGIVNGSNGMFNPQGVISRQDTMVMIAQILKGLNLNVNADTTALSQFGDANKVSAYANESVAILVNSGIIAGNNGKLNPTAPVTRAEMATIMSKLYDVLASANK